MKKSFRIFAIIFTAGCAGDDGQENGQRGGSGNLGGDVSDTGTSWRHTVREIKAPRMPLL